MSISPNKEVLEISSKSKIHYKSFTVYFIAIFVILGLSLTYSLWFLSQPKNQSRALITEQLASFKKKLLQQSYLIKTNKYIDEILQTSNANEAIILQQRLTLQSKKLLLLDSANHANHANFQEWLVNNNEALKTVIGIKSSHTANELLKNNSLAQLAALLGAIETLLSSQKFNTKRRQLLTTIQNKLSSLVIRLKDLNLHTSHSTFEQLQVHISDFFVEGYVRQLASAEPSSQDIADIVRDLISFENIILKQHFLSKWAGNLQLMADYHQQLTSQQQQLLNILHSLSNNADILSDSSLALDNQLTGAGNLSLRLLVNQLTGDGDLSFRLLINQLISAVNLPLRLIIILALTLLSIIVLLWLINRRIRAVILHTASCVKQTLEGEQSLEVFNQNQESWQFDNPIIVDTEPLVDEIVQDKQELAPALKVIGNDVYSKEKALLLEQQRCRDWYLISIKQLVLLGNSAVSTKINTKGLHSNNSDESYLYKAHLQGQSLARKLRETSYCCYLKSSDTVLTLSDVNFVAQVQAIIFNLRYQLLLCNNTVSVSIDEKIMSSVSIDAELFSEVFRVYILLLFSNKNDIKLVLRLALVDKNNGQQKVLFSGQIEGGERTKQLPIELQGFNNVDVAQSELEDYFNTLLQYQHGDNVNANLTDKGYQLSFTLPFVVTNNKEEHTYSTISLPGNLPEIELVKQKWSATYVAMPIEVLLAVKAPEKYQRLQQLLQSIGLQVTFVTCEVMQQKNWESGRFALLMTEFDRSPFTRFLIDDSDNVFDQVALIRGVFSLRSKLYFSDNVGHYSTWILGQLNAESTTEELIIVLKPWITLHNSDEVSTDRIIHTNDNDSCTMVAASEEDVSVMPREQVNTFNFGRYIENQGSAELAFFMLEEYTTENITLVAKLTKAFMLNNAKNLDEVIQRLSINANILAADNLLLLCQRWRQILSDNSLDNSKATQINLLDNTEQAVLAIYEYAEVVT